MFTVLTGNVAKNSNIFEITDNVIDDNSIIEVYPSDESIIPVEVSVTGSTLVVTFDSKAANIIPIKIFVNNLVGEYVPPSHETIDDENVINTNSSIPVSTQKEINQAVNQSIDTLYDRCGSGELDTEADNLTDAVNEINDRIPDGELGTFLYHGVNGNVWTPISAFNIDYDDNSTIYSAMGDIDELTTTSKNLVGAINEVKSSGSGLTYSTTEYDTGKTWIDGSKIYGIVLVTTSVPNANIPLTGVKDVISMSGIVSATTGQGYFARPLPMVDSNAANNIRLDYNPDMVRILGSGTWTGYTARIIVEYTKNE